MLLVCKLRRYSILALPGKYDHRQQTMPDYLHKDWDIGSFAWISALNNVSNQCSVYLVFTFFLIKITTMNHGHKVVSRKFIDSQKKKCSLWFLSFGLKHMNKRVRMKDPWSTGNLNKKTKNNVHWFRSTLTVRTMIAFAHKNQYETSICQVLKFKLYTCDPAWMYRNSSSVANILISADKMSKRPNQAIVIIVTDLVGKACVARASGCSQSPGRTDHVWPGRKSHVCMSR